jgi:hypothetical protein
MFVLAGLLVSASSASACGISWSLPSTPFAGNGDYRFQLAENWGEVEISKKRSIPIHVTFSPIGDRASPILGRDWQFALFDSTFVLANDHTYRMRLPDGNDEYLGKTKNASVWKGSNWVAQVAGRTVTAKSSCGWILTYNLGRLQQLKTPEGDTLDFVTDFGKGTRTLNANGKPVLILRPEFDKTTTQKFWHLNFSGKHAILKMGKRPFLTKTREPQTGKEAERKFEIDTLASVKFDGEPEKSYSFGVSDLKIGKHPYVWDKSSLMLIQNGNEKLSFVKVLGINCLRREKERDVSLFGHDRGKGISIRQSDKDEILVTEQVKGVNPLRGGLVRKVYSLSSPTATPRLKLQYWYDEDGNAIRKLENNGNESILYEKKKQMLRALNAKTKDVLWEKRFDAGNRLIYFRLAGDEYEFDYGKEKSSQWVAVTKKANGQVSKAELPVSQLQFLVSH